MTHAAAAALQKGDRTRARLILHDALANSPDDPDALTLMARLFETEGRPQEGTALLYRAVTADPDPERMRVLASHLRRHVSPEIAVKELQSLPTTVRERGELAFLYAGALGSIGQHDAEIAAYREMLELEPSDPRIWVCLGNSLRAVNRNEEAVRAMKRALRLAPTFGGAYWALANFKSYTFTSEELNQMLDLVAQPLRHDDALNIHFALGKAFEDIRQYERSFRHYALGNGLRSKTLDPGKVAVTAKVDDLIEHCSRETFTRAAGAGHQAADPIFIVGMHRAGSTLLEQILASHPLIEGSGELKAMQTVARGFQGSTTRTFGEAIAMLDPSELVSVGDDYLQRTRAFRRTERPYFIDKLPGNWINIPLIRLALPRAKIIDARRHPMACGFSNFRQNYAAGVAHSYSLRWIGEYYRNYWRFIRHFQEQQPGVIHTAINEQLVTDPEGETRRLLDYVGVPPAEACFEFYKNERAVSTPSADQVRRPLNRKGFDTWQSYEPWLGELKTALGDALEFWKI